MKNNFSLIELMAVMVIIAILLGLVVGVIPQLRERARRVKCAFNIRSVAVASMKYMQENEVIPVIFKSSEALANALRPYASDPLTLQCPSGEKTDLSYLTRVERFSPNDIDSTIPLIVDQKDNHQKYNFGNVLFGDGRVRGILGENGQSWTEFSVLNNPEKTGILGDEIPLNKLKWSSPGLE